MNAVLLYGPPTAGKDTVTAALCKEDARFQLVTKLKHGTVNSQIGRLTIRNTSMGCEVTIIDSSLNFFALHSCGSTRLERLRVEELVQINVLRGPVRITDTRVSSLVVRSQATGGRLGRPRVTARGLRAREDITFDDLWLSALDLDDVETPEFTLQRVRLDEPLRANELRCTETMRVNGLVIPAEDSTITNSTLRGPLEVRNLGLCASTDGNRTDAAARLSLHNTTVASLTSSSEASSVIGLHGSSITGTLGLPSGNARYSLDSSSSVGDMELAGQVFRDGGQILSFLERSFTEVTAVALESVRSALVRRNRNREVDELYYLARQRETADLPPLRRAIGRGILGGVLGWGVRARNPARVLASGVFLTGVILHLVGAIREPDQGLTDLTTVGKSFVLAIALWLNVGTGMPSELKTAEWTALAVSFTATGLLFTTLIVGMVIRKLVR
ncbi:hypothetical protein GCM10011583_63360 [Streptomyces camponoticapitis]|uniref:Uncharacterized protein n=1 Tax=Streptomyces camponoticapitis TaxID=1616125 RepID=A0ABQ2ERV2_9ACTN|nr:hypothetical protein [Streptomyces camponoticapitis]GGK22733.1 hypothetical protein GCM10011583_63360 [Streptomyces camponoticapitis]